MFISLAELHAQVVKFDERVAPGVIDYGTELRQGSYLETTGQAEVLPEHRGAKQIIEDIRVRGHLAATVELICARCLEPVSRAVERDFDLVYRPLGVDRGRDEVAITAADTEIGYYDGDGLLLEDVLREQVLLAVPLKAVCRDECRGLCPHCGKNRNVESCDCSETLSDPRWNALRDLKNL